MAFILVAVLQLAAERATLRSYDEGLVLYGASRVADGAMPYRDFWSMYGPGSYYALAGLARIFGESVLTGRLFDAASRAAIVLLVFALIWRSAGRTSALVCAGLSFVLLVVVRDYLFPALPATALALLSLYALARALLDRPAGAPVGWALVGASAGATLLFRHDFGLGVAFACLWSLVVPWGSERLGLRRATRACLAFVGGAVVVAGPLYCWLLAGMPVVDLYDNLVRIPMTVYVANRSLPFPHLFGTLHYAFKQRLPDLLLLLLVYLPPVVSLLGTALVVARRRGSAALTAGERASSRLFESALLLLLLLCAKGLVRVDLVQMLPAMVVSIVVAGLALPAVRWPGSRGSREVVLTAFLVAGFVLAVGSVRAWQAEPSLAARFADRADCAASGVARLGCFVVDADRLAVLRYLKQHARAGDALYVGAGRHDKLFVNNVELYFLSGLPAATKWADLHPGVQTTAVVQRTMIAEMDSRPPAFVVVNTAWDDQQEPNASRYSSGVTLLDDYLRDRYVPAFRSGSYTVSLPRAGAAP